jgi:hypothetical protein
MFYSKKSLDLTGKDVKEKKSLKLHLTIASGSGTVGGRTCLFKQGFSQVGGEKEESIR